jgi:hypothetical protein
MFKNLQWFAGLSAKEIVTALNAVLTEERALVLPVPDWNKLRLVPVESDINWESRMGDVLKPLKVPVKGYIGIAGNEPWPITGWLYEKEGLQELLAPYIHKSGLFYVSNESELATKAVTSIGTLISQGNSDIGEAWVVVNFLTDKNGTKLEVLATATFFALEGFNTKESKMATELAEWFVPIKKFGVADPVSKPTISVTKKEVRKEIKIKRSRRDSVTSSIHEYLDQCDTSNSRANIDDCWRFLGKELDLHGDGYLVWYTQKNKVKHTTRRQVSDRLINALKTHKTK